MKNTTACIAVALLFFVAIGCGEDDQKPPDPHSTATMTPTYTPTPPAAPTPTPTYADPYDLPGCCEFTEEGQHTPTACENSPWGVYCLIPSPSTRYYPYWSCDEATNRCQP